MIDLLFKQGFWLGMEVGFALVDAVLFYMVIYFWLFDSGVKHGRK